jgi:hypothetical protein
MNMLKSNVLCFVIVGFFLAGCQMSVPIAINQSKLIKPTSPPNIQLTMLSSAKDARTGYAKNQVGRHTWSLLMFPGFRVRTPQDLEVEIAERTIETLTSIGYEVTTVDKLNESQDPVVVIQVDTLRNLLFAWIYPLGITWGHMKLSVHLMSPDGDTLWETRLDKSSGMGASFLYMCGFKSRVKKDFTKNLNQIIEELSSEEFVQKLKKAQIDKTASSY